MNSHEVTKIVWKIVEEIKKDCENGYLHFIDAHKNIPDNWYDDFCIALISMCEAYIKQDPNANPTKIIFTRVILYLKNENITNNPLIKLEFRENPIVDCTSFVKYFLLLKKEGIITNTIIDLSDILSSITNFSPSTIKSYLGDIEKLSASEILLPNGYGKIKKKN